MCINDVTIVWVIDNFYPIMSPFFKFDNPEFLRTPNKMCLLLNSKFHVSIDEKMLHDYLFIIFHKITSQYALQDYYALHATKENRNFLVYKLCIFYNKLPSKIDKHVAG